MGLSISKNEKFYLNHFNTTYDYKLSSIRKLINGKINCFILNPGIIAEKLSEEQKFQKKYNINFWSSNVIDNLNDLIELGENDKDFESSIILLDLSNNRKLTEYEMQLLNELRVIGKPVYSAYSFYEHITGKISLIYLNNHWIVNTNEVFFVNESNEYHYFKRGYELVFCAIAIPFAILFSFPFALLLKMTSPGPLFFCQKRVGKNGKHFTLYKLRTMVHVLHGHTGHTVKNDHRITLIGRILRKTKIDELPQLYNILKGDMSLIGPRPEKVDIVQEMVKINPYYHLRHTILPGITGWAQINNPTATPDQNLEKLEYDLYYAKNMSPLFDLKIIFHTIKVVLMLDSL